MFARRWSRADSQGIHLPVEGVSAVNLQSATVSRALLLSQLAQLGSAQMDCLFRALHQRVPTFVAWTLVGPGEAAYGMRLVRLYLGVEPFLNARMLLHV